MPHCVRRVSVTHGCQPACSQRHGHRIPAGPRRQIPLGRERSEWANNRVSPLVGGRPSLHAAVPTGAALMAFAAHSPRCRLALQLRAIDAASFTAVCLASGAAMLVLVVGLRRSSPFGVGAWGRCGGCSPMPPRFPSPIGTRRLQLALCCHSTRSRLPWRAAASVAARGRGRGSGRV